jgi:hypothetical protein
MGPESLALSGLIRIHKQSAQSLHGLGFPGPIS